MGQGKSQQENDDIQGISKEGGGREKGFEFGPKQGDSEIQHLGREIS